MPTLPLPIGDTPIDGGELPVKGPEDLLPLMPRVVREATTAPVRDALLSALAAIQLAWQDRASYAAAQSDVLRAKSLYLDEIGGQERDVFRLDSETDEAYRARIYAPVAVVTPDAIVGAANTLLATRSTTLSAYYESLDGWFVRDDNAGNWASYVFDSTQEGRPPTYTTRLYDADVAVNGVSVPRRKPAGACVFDDNVGRFFVLRIPETSHVDAEIGAADDGTFTTGYFAGDGTETVPFSFTFASVLSEDDLYSGIVSAINRIKGHGVRWILVVDPYLT